MDEILDITLTIASTCERLGVPYLVGGSLASSLHGIPRATQDVDLVASLGDEHVAAFADALRDAFYLDIDVIRTAIATRGSFNVIHLGSFFKADIFIAGSDEPSRIQMSRRQTFRLDGDPPRTIVVASARTSSRRSCAGSRWGTRYRSANGAMRRASQRRRAAASGIPGHLACSSGRPLAEFRFFENQTP